MATSKNRTLYMCAAVVAAGLCVPAVAGGYDAPAPGSQVTLVKVYDGPNTYVWHMKDGVEVVGLTTYHYSRADGTVTKKTIKEILDAKKVAAVLCGKWDTPGGFSRRRGADPGHVGPGSMAPGSRSRPSVVVQ